MPEKSPSRKPRADAERNRQRLLEIARSAFAEKGVSASLEEIARSAGVGIGTLYRHFPTRDALLDEIYREEGDQLLDAASSLSRELPPLEALRKWLLLFVNYLENKQIMAAVLNSMSGDSDKFCTLSGEKLIGALDALLTRAKRSGDVISKVESLDMLCAIAGIASFGGEPGWETSAKRLIDIMVAGVRKPSLTTKRSVRLDKGRRT